MQLLPSSSGTDVDQAALQGLFLSYDIVASARIVPRQMQSPWRFSLSCADIALQPGSTALLGTCAAAESTCNSLGHFTWAKQHVYSAIRFEARASSHPNIACQLWQLSQP